MSYTTGREVAGALGQDYDSLPVEQQSLADLTADAATAYIDRKTSRPFTETPTAVLAELHGIDGPALYLLNTPVVSIEQVRTRVGYAGVAWTVLAPTSYELLDPSVGLTLTIPLADPITAPSLDLVVGIGWLASVDYTWLAPCPPDVHLAALELASSSFQVWQSPDLRRYKSITIGQMSVTIGDVAQASAGVQDVIASYRKLLIA